MFNYFLERTSGLRTLENWLLSDGDDGLGHDANVDGNLAKMLTPHLLFREQRSRRQVQWTGWWLRSKGTVAVQHSIIINKVAAHALPLPILPEFSSSTPDVGGSSNDMGEDVKLPGAKMIDGERATVSDVHVHSARGGLAAGMYETFQCTNEPEVAAQVVAQLEAGTISRQAGSVVSEDMASEPTEDPGNVGCSLSTEPVYLDTARATKRSQQKDARPKRIRNDAAFVARHPYGQQTHREFIIYDRAFILIDQS